MSFPTSAFTRNMHPRGLRITVWESRRKGRGERKAICYNYSSNLI